MFLYQTDVNAFRLFNQCHECDKNKNSKIVPEKFLVKILTHIHRTRYTQKIVNEYMWLINKPNRKYL